MKALTLQQPYATLGALGLKPWETRSKPTKFRGRHLITASAGWKPEYKIATVELAKKYTDIDFINLPFGSVIGHVEITDCVTTLTAVEIMRKEVADGKITKQQMEMYIAFGDFSPGRWAYKWERPVSLAKPVECKGALGVYDTQLIAGNFTCQPGTAVEGQERHMYYLGEPLYQFDTTDEQLWQRWQERKGIISGRINAIEKRLFKL